MGELLLTRFTHDIAGPISAVANGLDFIMGPGNKGKDEYGGATEIKNQAIDLIEDSSKQSLARLQAYRLAYGVVYNDSVETESAEVKEIFKRFFHKSQIEIRWNGSFPQKISAAERRICVGMVLTMSRILIYGGKISISYDESNKRIVVKSQSDKFKEPNLIKEIISGNKDIEPDVENIPYFFIREICENSGVKIKFDYNDDEVKMVEFIAGF